MNEAKGSRDGGEGDVKPRILFLNAPFDSGDLRFEGSRMPLGQLAIASHIQDIADVKVIDISTCSESMAREVINRFAPHHFGITLYDKLLPQTKKLVNMLKESFPGVMISIGGPMATTFPLPALYHCKADAVFSGEAEETFRDFIKIVGRDTRFRQDPAKVAALRGIKGLSFFDESGSPISRGGKPTIPIETLESLPFTPSLAKELVSDKTFHLCTSRGCPFNCVFCTKVHGNRYRAWSAEKLLDLLEEILSQMKKGELPPIEKISIHDDDFFFDRERAIRISKSLAEKRLPFKFGVQSNIFSFFRKGVLDSELLDAAERLNISSIRFGTDSLNEPELARLGKPMRDLAKIRELILECAKRGISTIHYLILTTPETRAGDFMDCLFNAAGLKISSGCHFLINHYIIPIPGSQFFTDLLRKKIPFSFTMEKAEGHPEYDYPMGFSSSISDPVIVRTLMDFTERQVRNGSIDTHEPELYIPLFFKHLRRYRKSLDINAQGPFLALEKEWKQRYALLRLRSASDGLHSRE